MFETAPAQTGGCVERRRYYAAINCWDRFRWLQHQLAIVGCLPCSKQMTISWCISWIFPHQSNKISNTIDLFDSVIHDCWRFLEQLIKSWGRLTLSLFQRACRWWCPWWRSASPYASLDTWEGLAGGTIPSGPNAMCSPRQQPRSHHPLLWEEKQRKIWNHDTFMLKWLKPESQVFCLTDGVYSQQFCIWEDRLHQKLR